jgi:hypothetical protein
VEVSGHFGVTSATIHTPMEGSPVIPRTWYNDILEEISSHGAYHTKPSSMALQLNLFDWVDL